MHRVRNVVLAVVAALVAASCGTATEKGPSPAGAVNEVSIPRGSAPAIDGKLSDGEWTDAGKVQIMVREGWPVTVYLKQDGQNLFAAFQGVRNQEGEERYAEVLLDVPGQGVKADLWWIHASYNDCDASGKVNDWASCKPSREGWEANNYPLQGEPVIEMRISYAMVGLQPGSKEPIGFALNVTDTQTAQRFWPDGALLEMPESWGKAFAPQGW